MVTSSPFGVSLPRAAASSAITTTAMTANVAPAAAAKKHRTGLWIGIGLALGAISAGVGYAVLRR